MLSGLTAANSRPSVAVLVGLLASVAGCNGPGEAPESLASARPAEFRREVVAVPAGPGSAQAHLATLPGGGLLLSWLEPLTESGHALRFATWDGDTWSEVRTVVSRERFFVNWADFPSVVAIDSSHWIAHWLERRPDSFGAYDAYVSVSDDGGRSWSRGARLNEDDTEAEHGFVEVFDGPGGPSAFWLDGRELAEWSFDNPDALLGVSLRVARITDGGNVEDRRVVDEMVCDCCQPDVEIAEGTPVVTYRDRTASEIRDIVVRRQTGDGWSAPTAIGGERWQIEGCPVNGPAIDAAGSDVAVAWFTAADARPRVRFVRSADAGRSFGAPVDLDTEGALGQVDVELVDGGDAVVSWWRRGAGEGIDLVLRRIPVTGPPGPVRVVGHEAVSQPVDVPQLQQLDDALLLVWSSFDGDGLIRASRVSGR